MESDLTVRRATERDVDGIHRVAERAWQETYDGLLAEETVATILASGHAAGSIEDMISARETAVFVTRADGAVVGYSSTEPVGTGAIGNLAVYVDPDYWGAGIGERLLDRTAEEMRERGRSQIRDAVLQGNEVGNAFYRKHFEQVGERDVEVAGETHAANVYEMDL